MAEETKRKGDPVEETPVEEAPVEEPPVPEEEELVPEAPAEEANPWEEKYNAEHDARLRIAAEYDNFRKRTARERDAIYADVRADTVVKFLPVYDNLLRAIAMTPEGDPGRKGVEIFGEPGDSFDPSLHNAVMHTEDPAVGENIVVEEFEKGFRLGDKVIRFSMVKVAN